MDPLQECRALQVVVVVRQGVALPLVPRGVVQAPQEGVHQAAQVQGLVRVLMVPAGAVTRVSHARTRTGTTCRDRGAPHTGPHRMGLHHRLCPTQSCSCRCVGSGPPVCAHQICPHLLQRRVPGPGARAEGERLLNPLKYMCNGSQEALAKVASDRDEQVRRQGLGAGTSLRSCSWVT